MQLQINDDFAGDGDLVDSGESDDTATAPR
jgi:hypothetical protein